MRSARGIFIDKRRGVTESSPLTRNATRGPSLVTVIGVPACTVGSESMILVNKPLLLLSKNILAEG